MKFAGRLQFLEGVAKAAGLDGAPWGVGPGIEEKDHRLAGIIRKAYGFVLVGLEREVGDFLMELHGEYPRNRRRWAMDGRQV